MISYIQFNCTYNYLVHKTGYINVYGAFVILETLLMLLQLTSGMDG